MSISKYNDGHDLYRTKNQMIEDLLLIYEGNSALSNGSRNGLIESFLYEWTEFNGKFEGCYLWSKKALIHWEEAKQQKKNPFSQLRHEHIVPRKVFKRIIALNFTNDFQKMQELFTKYLLGVIVTKEEDSLLLRDSMPEDWDVSDEWARYRDKPIDLYYVPWIINENNILTYSPTPYEIKNRPISFKINYSIPPKKKSKKKYTKIDYNTDWRNSPSIPE